MRLALHRFAIALAGATLGLVFVGGLVTSTGSGLAVPDWPLSFGQVFPPMVGGVFYEHGHRMVAAAVGFLTVLLALWAWIAQAPLAVRRLALAAVVMVIAQGVLGGATVLLGLPPAVSIAHACLAQAFLCVTVALAVLTAPDWVRPAPARAHGAPSRSSLATIAVVTAAATYAQLLLGATMRHTGAGLAIPDFPLAFGRLVPPLDDPRVALHFAHRVGAVVIGFLVCWCAAYARAFHRDEPRLVRPALVAAGLVVVQVTLGALTIWTGRAVVPTTFHVAVGAALLATVWLLSLRAWKLAPHETPITAPLFTSERAAT